MNENRKIINPYLLKLLKSLIRFQYKGNYLENLTVNERLDLGEKLGIGKDYNVKIFSVGKKTPFSLDLNTLDLLIVEIKHLGYHDWNDFVKKELDKEAMSFPEIPYQNLDKENQEKINTKISLRINEINTNEDHSKLDEEKKDLIAQKKTKNNKKNITIKILAGLLPCIMLSFYFLNSQNSDAKIQATSKNYFRLAKNNALIAPQTVYFDFDVSDLPKPITIKYYGLEEKITIDTIKTNIGTIGQYYERPGTYKVFLYSKNTLLFEESFSVNTDGWYSLAGPINKDKLEKLYELEQPCDFIDNDVMVFPKKGFRDIIYCHFTKVGDIGIDGSNFEFTVKMRNNSLKEYDSRIWLWGKKGTKLVACFVGEGAEKYSYLYLGDDKKISGKNHAFLKNFSFDLSFWRFIKVIMRDNYMSIYLDNELIVEPMLMKEPLISIEGIRITFKGYGEIDSLGLKDAQKEIHEKFDNCDIMN